MSEPWIVENTVSDQELTDTLQEHGFAIVREALAPEQLALLYDELDQHFAQAEYCEGLFYGKTTKRFGRVLSKSQQAQQLVLNRFALQPARAILGQSCEDIQLNLTQAIEISPGSLSQAPHRDQDIWLGAAHPGEMMLNAMWALDDFTRENGATLVWPGTHRRPDMQIPDTDGVAAVMPAGSLCLFLGSTIHNGGANWSDRPRRGLVMSYCLGWLKPCENPWLSYPPEVARDFAPELARLIGYRQDCPSLNNVDGRCPSELLYREQPRPAFVDKLSEEQIAMIEQFNEMQLAYNSKAA
ncbi:MAG: phytanoyl-CoA dioxygenase family protein [Novosphingobium sp.]|nr:phytanoyl-CoA dioxygenase family protein [Novosphingobium sp.]MCP5401016.1 phytanoyl-CoA dioxygenase family protein [Novosphingobium sp.]